MARALAKKSTKNIKSVADLRLIDVIDPLAELAAEALMDPYGRGMQFARATPVVVAEPGARVDISGAIVIGKDMRGRVRDGSFVLDLGRGRFEAHDSVIAGDRVRVISRGKVVVKGKKARVFSQPALAPNPSRQSRARPALPGVARRPRKQHRP